MRNATAIIYAVLVVIIVIITTGCSGSLKNEKNNLANQGKTTLNNATNTTKTEFLPEINRMEYTAEITAGNVNDVMVLVEKSPVKIEGVEASVELYIDSEVKQEGGKTELLLDDGQLWSLLVRQDGNVYPLIYKQFIQMGKMNYIVYASESTKELSVYATIEEQAGLSMKEFVYVSDKEPYFTKKDIDFTNSGNLSFADKSSYSCSPVK